MKQLLEELYKNISKYQSIPFWSWNDKLEEEELLRQIEWMQDNGIGGCIMHARGGLKTQYLSEEWMQCIDACVQEAQKRDMEAWVYDENGWPSGFVGGKLLEKEENRDRYLSCSIGNYDESAWLQYALEGDTIRRLQGPEEGECLNVFLHISPSSVDILNPRVVREFLDETHEKYSMRYGLELSKSIAGFFTDEPQYYRWEMPYTCMMPGAFEERYGEDVLDSLGLLFVEKKGYQKFRYRYWLTMQQLMLDSFAKQVYDWCNEHGVRLTGHYVEEILLVTQMTCCAGVMPFYKYMHIPGIDWLNRSLRNMLSLRQVASVAKQMGKEQVLSETFGCCGWDVTPQELKCIADFQYVGGVNRMCHHLLPYSEHGQRKRDYPAHFSAINPWVKEHFKEFNDYYTRLGYLLASTKEVVQVAVLHPMRSAYLDFRYVLNEGEKLRIEDLDQALAEQMQQLTEAQIPFHFLDETLLEEDGFVHDDRIGCGLCEYEYLVIPTCYTMGQTTEKLIRQYVENGGKVLLLDEKPTYLEGESYDYSYLESTITFEQLSEGLPYTIEKPVEKMHSTTRKYDNGYFIFVQNYGTETKTVQYILKEGYSSFELCNMDTMSSTIVPTSVTLEAGESAVLLFSKQEVDEQAKKEVVYLPLAAEVIERTENYMTLDKARYSKNGKEYSEELSCMGIFQLLLEEHYEGPLYLEYTFKAKEKPSQISLIVEKQDNLKVSVNGKVIDLKNRWERDHQIMYEDVTAMVECGENTITYETYFWQSEDVYYALFGENVTENLRNCLSYDTEIESIYLAGDFGVYSDEFTSGIGKDILVASEFYLGKAKDQIENLITDGYPFFSGQVTLRRTIELKQKEAILEFKGRFHAMTVWVNGQNAGSMLFENQLDISEFSRVGTNEIVIQLIVGNRNLLGPHHITGNEEPISVGPYTFEAPGTWKYGKSNAYRESYAFVSVPLN